MKQYTEPKTIKFSKIQMESLDKLKEYSVDIPRFIRQAIKEKIQRDWKMIKDKKEKVGYPF